MSQNPLEVPEQVPQTLYGQHSMTQTLQVGWAEPSFWARRTIKLSMDILFHLCTNEIQLIEFKAPFVST